MSTGIFICSVCFTLKWMVSVGAHISVGVISAFKQTNVRTAAQYTAELFL